MLGVVQESVRLFLKHIHSQLGTPAQDAGELYLVVCTPYSQERIKGFTLNGAETNRCLCLCLGVQYLEPSLNQNGEEPNCNWLQEIHWNDSGKPGHKNQSKDKDLSDCTQEIRSHQFSLTLAFSLHSSLMVLAWQLSSLRLLHLVRESKLPALRF